jgi:hypothetical protein
LKAGSRVHGQSSADRSALGAWVWIAKTNIHPLLGAIDEVTQLQGVTYVRKADGRHEIGVVAEDVEGVLPEVVSRDPETDEIQGVDDSRLAALLIEAVKSQQG